MLKRSVLALGCVLAAGPGIASAGLDPRIGPNRGPDDIDATVIAGSGEHFFDLTFRNHLKSPVVA